MPVRTTRRGRPITAIGTLIDTTAAGFYPATFRNANAGFVYALESFPVLYRRALAEIKGKFTRDELLFILDIGERRTFIPDMAGQQLAGDITGVKYLDGTALNSKIASLASFQRAALEIWANGFWYADKHNPEQYTPEERAEELA